jgi:cytochrome c-type biogenesis protein CcmH
MSIWPQPLLLSSSRGGSCRRGDPDDRHTGICIYPSLRAGARNGMTALYQKTSALTPHRHSRERGNPSPIAFNSKGLRGTSLGPRLRGDGGGTRRDYWRLVLLIGLLLALCSGPVLAVDPQEQLKDPSLEARAREISAGLRCLVCQNQSIDDSDAPLAKDLRFIVRQQLQKGGSNSQVIDYIVARYGEFVLLKPRLRLNTLILWLTPLLLLAGGFVLAARIVRRQPETRTAPPLTPEEQSELQSLLAPPGTGKS